MCEKSTNNIVNGANFSPSLPVLRGSVRTRKTKNHSNLVTNFLKGRIGEFCAIGDIGDILFSCQIESVCSYRR